MLPASPVFSPQLGQASGRKRTTHRRTCVASVDMRINPVFASLLRRRYAVVVGSNTSRTEWVVIVVLAVSVIVIASLSWVAGLITAWLLGTLAGVALIYIRARRLGVPPSISLLLPRGHTPRSRQ